MYQKLVVHLWCNNSIAMKNTAIISSFKSFAQMLEVLNTETKCREFLENLRWNNEPVCPHCGSKNKAHYELKTKGEFKGLHKCKDCRERFTVTVGTMFEGSHIPLRKWFIAVYIFSSHKKGISSLQLHRDLDVTQKTAWFMLGRLRNTFKTKTVDKFTTPTQADETFVGGKNKNRHAHKKVKDSQGRSFKDKTPVFGLLNNGMVNTRVVPDTKATTLKPIIAEMVEKGSIIVTDEWGAYNGLSSDYQHEVLKHNDGQFVNANNFHTLWGLLSMIGGFFAVLIRVRVERKEEINFIKIRLADELNEICSIIGLSIGFVLLVRKTNLLNQLLNPIFNLL